MTTTTTTTKQKRHHHAPHLSELQHQSSSSSSSKTKNESFDSVKTDITVVAATTSTTQEGKKTSTDEKKLVAEQKSELKESPIEIPITVKNSAIEPTTTAERTRKPTLFDFIKHFFSVKFFFYLRLTEFNNSVLNHKNYIKLKRIKTLSVFFSLS